MFILTEVKYQLMRNKNRSALTVCIAALLVCCMALYLGNIQSGEAALENLAEAIPVSAQIVSRDGTNTVGLEIAELHFDGIMSAGIKDPVYTASAYGIIDEKYRTEDEVQGVDTSISGANCLAALVGLTEESITFLDGWDGAFLESDAAVCVLSDQYAAQHGFAVGDTVTMPFYVPRYKEDGFTIRFDDIGELSVQVIGIYQQSLSDSATPVQMIVPVNWLRKVTAESGQRFLYDSFRCTVADPMRLNDFKEAVRKSNFGKVATDTGGISVPTNTYKGDALVVDDQLFIETAEKLQQNLKVLRWFLVPFFALVIVLVTLVTFLVLRSSRRDMAIAVSLGRSKLQSAVSYFFGTLLADAVGCAIALLVLLLATGLAMTQILTILGLFLLCACAGVGLALLFLLRFDALALLTKID